MIFYRRASLGQTDVTHRLWVSPGSAHFPFAVCPSATDTFSSRFFPARPIFRPLACPSPIRFPMTKYTFYMHRICINFSSCIWCIFIHLSFSSCIHLHENIFTTNPHSPFFPQSLFFFLSLKSFFICRIFPFMLPVKRRKSEDCRSAIPLFCHSVLLCCSAVLSFCFSLPSFQQSIIIGLAVYIPPLHPAWLTWFLVR